MINDKDINIILLKKLLKNENFKNWNDAVVMKSFLNGNKEIMELCIKEKYIRNKYIRKRDKYGCTAIIWASKYGHKDLIEIFINDSLIH